MGGGLLGWVVVKPGVQPPKEAACQERGVTPPVPGARPHGSSGARGVLETGRERAAAVTERARRL